jgi:hypothetical protein
MLLDAGETTMPRYSVYYGVQPGTQNLRLTYITARRSETIGNVRTVCAGPGSSMTLNRIGIYSAAESDGSLTLVASTPSDTSMWSTGSNTVYTKALSASFNKVRGSRYAVGVLSVATATPNLMGYVYLPASEMAASTAEPRITGFVSGQSDLPSTIAAGSISQTSQSFYVVLAP